MRASAKVYDHLCLSGATIGQDGPGSYGRNVKLTTVGGNLINLYDGTVALARDGEAISRC